MTILRRSAHSIAIAAIALFSVSIMPVAPVSAAVIGNEQISQDQTVEDARETVRTFMAREDVREQFEGLGVDPDEADLRVAALSDAEIQKLAGEINSAPSGQGPIGTIVGAAVLIFLVLLITDILGLTSVFDFTNKGTLN